MDRKEDLSLYTKVDHNLHINSGRKRQSNNRLFNDKGNAAFFKSLSKKKVI